MGSLTNYTLSEFLKQPLNVVQQYMEYLKYLQPIDTNIQAINLTVMQVDNFKIMLDNPSINNMVEVVAAMNPKRAIYEMKITEFFGLFNSVKKQFEDITKSEQHLVSVFPNEKFDMVEGGKKMQKFGIYNTLISLAEQFHTIPQEIEKWTYSYVFTILLYNVTKGDIQKQMEKLKTVKT